ncbi:MAG: NYN domain-containing protein [Candidatus Uhrbacteria bacterium]
MNRFKNNFAYIDGNNLYRGVKNSGWAVDMLRFRKWLSDKFGVTRAYYFIGLISKETYLYTNLQEAGFTLVFKEIIYDDSGKPKGNCDADLVLRSVIDVFENNCQKQILVTSDGDYAGLVKFLKEKNKLEVILSPNESRRCSVLLKRTNSPIVYLNGIRRKIEYMKKPPVRTEP